MQHRFLMLPMLLVLLGAAACREASETASSDRPPDPSPAAQTADAASWRDAFFASDTAEEALEVIREAGLDFRAIDALAEQNLQLGNDEAVVALADYSLRFADADSYKADVPGTSDADAETYGRRRVAFSMALKGTAQARLGEVDGALESFARGAEATHRGFLGVDETPVSMRWAALLLDQGEPEKAVEVLGIDGVHGSAEGRDLMRRAWIAARGSEDGLENHLFDLRTAHAPRVENVVLADYDGGEVDLESLRGEVLLLAFWFPT